MIRNAIVPMNVGCAIYNKPVIFGQLFAPGLLVSVNSPIITIVSAPQNCFSIFVQELLGNNTTVIGFNIHYANGVITFISDGNGISANNIKEEIFVCARNRFSNSLNITFNGKVRFISAIIFTLLSNQLSLLGPKYSGAAIDAISLSGGNNLPEVWENVIRMEKALNKA